MTRALHHVGSLPPELAETDTAAMTWFLDHSKGHEILAVPGRQPEGWVVDWLDALKHNPAFRIVADGDYRSGYDGFRAYAVEYHHTLRPEEVSFGNIYDVREQMRALRVLRERRPDADRPLLISVPHPIDLAFFTFGGRSFPLRRPKPVDVWRTLRNLPVFTEAVVRFVNRVTREFGGADVAFQLEMPTALVLMHKAAQGFGSKSQLPAAALHAAHTASLLNRLHAHARVILHLCYGDWQHEPVFRPTTLALPVRYLNLLARNLRRREYGAAPEVHIPAVWGAEQAVVAEEFYEPLTTLDRVWRRVIAGVATEVRPERAVAALHLMETAMDREAHAVAPACGHGRRTVDDTVRCVAVQRTVASAVSTITPTTEFTTE